MMGKDKYIHKLYAFALAAVFALTLAGCGGGGGGSAAAPDPEPPTMPEPTPQEMCEGDGGRYNADGSCTSAADLAEEMALSGAQSGAAAAASAAMAAVAGAKDPVAAANAQMYADAAMTASASAAAATTSAMAMEYQTAAEAAQASAEMAAGDRGLRVTMLANDQLNGEDIANAELEGTKPPAYRSNASNVGAAMAIAAGATATVSTDNAMTNLGGASNSTTASPVTPATVDAPATGAVADHKAAGSTFTLELGAGNAFLEGETPSRFQTKGGWEAQDLVYRAAAATDKTHLVVNTDIQADTQNYEATAAVAAGTTGGVIVAGEVAGDGSNFAATLNVNPADNNPPVAGQFQCSTAPTTACSISVDASGKIVANTGYAFHESDGTTKADSDYLAWGFWVTGSTLDSLSGTTPPNTAPPAQAGAFAYGSDVFIVSPELKGTATYNGDASGLYSAAGMVEYFDADVSLTANFGGTVGADNSPADAANDGLLIGAVTGSITNIRAGGMDVAGSLTLEKATVTRTATGNPAGAFLTSGSLTLDPASGNNSVAGFTDDVSGTLAGRAMDGTWRGQFYGPNRARSATAAETEYPTTAAGTFAAEAPGHSGDPVRIMGSFGSWKAD